MFFKSLVIFELRLLRDFAQYTKIFETLYQYSGLLLIDLFGYNK